VIRLKKIILSILGIISLITLLAVPVFAGSSSPGLSVSSSTVVGVFVLEGDNFDHSRTVSITFGGLSVLTIPEDVKTSSGHYYGGDFSCVVGVPNVPAGTYTVTASTCSGSKTASIIVVVPDLKGDKGDTGLQGLQGLQGDIGPQGLAGVNGIDGAVGPQGEQGIQGWNGLQGIQGLQGEPGIDGVDGINGVDGTDGRDGTDGKDGVDGIDGADGINGIDGIDGIDGEDGIDGIDGSDGLDGTVGAEGATGATGTEGIAGLTGYPDIYWMVAILCLAIAAAMGGIFAFLFSIKKTNGTLVPKKS